MTQFTHTLTHFGTVHTLFTSYDTVHKHFDIVHAHFGTVHTLFTNYDTVHTHFKTVHTHFGTVHTHFKPFTHTLAQFTHCSQAMTQFTHTLT